LIIVKIKIKIVETKVELFVAKRLRKKKEFLLVVIV